MLDRERFYQWQERARGGDVTQILDPEEDIRPLAEMCMDMGCQILLIKCGAPGMYFKTAGQPSSGTALLQSGDGSRTVGAGREIFERSYIPERILSGTGPGDTQYRPLFSLRFLRAADRKRACISPLRPARSCVAEYDALKRYRNSQGIRRENKQRMEKI